MTKFEQVVPVTEAERELLEMLAEEAAEVVQAVTKVLRHGWMNHHPGNLEMTNRGHLCKELLDLMGVAYEIFKEDLPMRFPSTEALESVWAAKLRWTHRQGYEHG